MYKNNRVTTYPRYSVAVVATTGPITTRVATEAGLEAAWLATNTNKATLNIQRVSVENILTLQFLGPSQSTAANLKILSYNTSPVPWVVNTLFVYQL